MMMAKAMPNACEMMRLAATCREITSLLAHAGGAQGTQRASVRCQAQNAYFFTHAHETAITLGIRI
jgi:hypothetical protein